MQHELGLGNGAVLAHDSARHNGIPRQQKLLQKHDVKEVLAVLPKQRMVMFSPMQHTFNFMKYVCQLFNCS